MDHSSQTMKGFEPEFTKPASHHDNETSPLLSEQCMEEGWQSSLISSCGLKKALVHDDSMLILGGWNPEEISTC